MNIEKFCQGLLDVIDLPVNHPKRIESATKAKFAIQNFFEKEPINFKAKMQAQDSVGASTNLARVATDSYNFIMDKVEYDNAWEMAFKKVPVANGSDNWEIHTGTSGIVLQQRAEGEKLELKSVNSTKQTVYVYKYGEAIGIYDEFIRFRKIAAMFDLLSEARDAYLIGKSGIFYNLLIQAAAVNVTPYQGAVGDGEARRDILTLNAGTVSIGNRMRTKDANASRAPIILYANPDDESRIEAIFRARTSELITQLNIGTEVTRRPIQRVYTYFVNSLAPILVWPGRKNQWSELLGLTQLTQQDILTWMFIQAYWTYFGGICADTDQMQTISLA